MEISERKLNKKYKYYQSLIDKPYSELIGILIQKYGNVSDDFFREKSYQRFLNGEIKTITRGKYKRTGEGLYTHHIFEDQFENLSNTQYIHDFRYDFYYQRKQNLVYCDLIEHLILHAIIASETDGEFGYSGYECYLKDMVEEWFTTDMVPKPNWMKLAYQRAFLTSNQANSIIRLLENGPLKRVNELIREQDRMLHIAVHDFNDLWHDSSGNLSMFWALYSDDEFNNLWEKVKIKTSAYIDNDSLLKHDLRIIFKDYLYSPEEAALILQQIAKRERIKKAKWEKEFKERERIEQEKHAKWIESHQLILSKNINLNLPRRKLLKMLFDGKYKEQYDSFKTFTSSRINSIRDDLYDELEEMLEEQKNKDE